MARDHSNTRYWLRKNKSRMHYGNRCYCCNTSIDNVYDCILDTKQVYPIYPGKSHTPNQWRMYGSDILAYIHNDLWFDEVKEKCVLLCDDCGKKWKRVLLLNEYNHIDEFRNHINGIQDDNVIINNSNDNIIEPDEMIAISRNELNALKDSMIMMNNTIIRMSEHFNGIVEVIDNLMNIKSKQEIVENCANM